MRKIIAALCLVACLAGCAAIQHTASVSFVAAQSGLEYLQATYTRLQASGGVVSLADLNAYIARVASDVATGNLTAMATDYESARAEVTKVVAAIKG
jgi:hypothetical protein